MGTNLIGYRRSNSSSGGSENGDGHLSLHSSVSPRRIPRSSPISPETRWSQLGGQKVVRSTSHIPGLRGSTNCSLSPQPSYSPTAQSVSARAESAAITANGPATAALSTVLRTQSAGELEHYRMTSGILNIGYRDITDWFDLGEELGTGSSGVIRRCVNRHTKEAFACKTIPKSRLQCVEAVEDVQNEVRVMQVVGDHPSIVGLKEVFEDQQAVHLVLELCEGGDLYERIQQCKVYTEVNAARVCRRLISVIHHCHSVGVMHRDLKPENILLLTEESAVNIRVADFGQAAFLKPGAVMTQAVGSVFYIAPEVLKKRYGPAADMWSVGVILYILLCGMPPFAGANRRATFEQIQSAALDLKRGSWQGVSEEAKDLVRRMLDKDPATRITPAQAKVHPWMLMYCPPLPQASATAATEETAHAPVAPPISMPGSDAAVLVPAVDPNSLSPKNLPKIRTNATLERVQHELGSHPSLPTPRLTPPRSPSPAASPSPHSPASDPASSRCSSFSQSPSPRSILSCHSLPSPLRPKGQPPIPGLTPSPPALPQRSHAISRRFSLDLAQLGSSHVPGPHQHPSPGEPPAASGAASPPSPAIDSSRLVGRGAEEKGPSVPPGKLAGGNAAPVSDGAGLDSCPGADR